MIGPTARRVSSALFAPLPILAALAITAIVLWFAPGVPADAQRATALAAVVICSVLGAILAHDAAHWIAARALGFRTVCVTFGPFAFAPTRRGLHVRVVRSWREFGGGLIVEPRAERRMNARWALVAAAGPAASLGLGMAVLGVAPVLAVASLLRFALAALPIGVRGIPSDGAQLLLLVAGGAPADRLSAMMRIAAAQRAGVRPRAWLEIWTSDAIALRDGTMAEALACMAAFRRAVDGCAHDRASALLDRALALRAQLPRVAACALLADAAYFEARIHDDATRARGWLEEAATRRPACPVAERRASAAVLIASGDFAGGADAARAALIELERIERDERRTLPMEADWLREMLARAEYAIVLPAELFALAG